MNDRYFVALGWVGFILAVALERFERAVGWLRDEWTMLRQVTAVYRKGNR